VDAWTSDGKSWINRISTWPSWVVLRIRELIGIPTRIDPCLVPWFANQFSSRTQGHRRYNHPYAADCSHYSASSAQPLRSRECCSYCLSRSEWGYIGLVVYKETLAHPPIAVISFNLNVIHRLRGLPAVDRLHHLRPIFAQDSFANPQLADRHPATAIHAPKPDARLSLQWLRLPIFLTSMHEPALYGTSPSPTALHFFYFRHRSNVVNNAVPRTPTSANQATSSRPLPLAVPPSTPIPQQRHVDRTPPATPFQAQQPPKRRSIRSAGGFVLSLPLHGQ